MTQLIIQILLSLNLFTSDVDVNKLNHTDLNRICQEHNIVGTEMDDQF